MSGIVLGLGEPLHNASGGKGKPGGGELFLSLPCPRQVCGKRHAQAGVGKNAMGGVGRNLFAGVCVWYKGVNGVVGRSSKAGVSLLSTKNQNNQTTNQNQICHPYYIFFLLLLLLFSSFLFFFFFS